MGNIPFEELVERVIWQESRGNPRAVSPAGAAGIMQIMPGTAASPGYGVRPMDWSARFDPEENRRFGTDYLRAMLDHFGGDVERALVAYNWGPGNAQRWSGDRSSLPAETSGYLAAILGGAAPPAGARRTGNNRAQSGTPMHDLTGNGPAGALTPMMPPAPNPFAPPAPRAQQGASLADMLTFGVELEQQRQLENAKRPPMLAALDELTRSRPR